MENDTDNDQGDKDFKDMEVKEEVLDHEIGQVEEELVIIPVQENRSKNVKGFSDKRGLQVIHFVDCPEGVLCELCSKQLPSHAALEKHRKAKHSDISFACEECGKQFKTVKNLLDHQRSHKTCVCYKCGKCISAINYIYISFKLLAYYFDKRPLWDPHQCDEQNLLLQPITITA